MATSDTNQETADNATESGSSLIHKREDASNTLASGIQSDENEQVSEAHSQNAISGKDAAVASDKESSDANVDHLQHLRSKGMSPRRLLTSLLGAEISDEEASEETLWQLLLGLMSEPPKRRRLESVNTMADIVQLLKTCRRVLVLTGAGVSVSCGIPDFRSPDGLYARLSREYPQLPSPQAMFDIDFFCSDPRPFFKFAKEIFPSQFVPSRSHRFIRCLEQRQQLLRNYTQNIDTLEQAAGIQRVLNCHGSFATASCMHCRRKVDLEFIKDDVLAERIPMCPDCGPDCQPSPVLKPDIVFFGESLPPEFARSLETDERQADLLIVMGSSLKVQPVSLIPTRLPDRVPQILINREPLRHHEFDACLLGDCDQIVAELCQRLNWPEVAGEAATEISGRQLLTRWSTAGGEGGVASHLPSGTFANCGRGVFAFDGAQIEPDDVIDGDRE